jgi:hypothetical protein
MKYFFHSRKGILRQLKINTSKERSTLWLDSDRMFVVLQMFFKQGTRNGVLLMEGEPGKCSTVPLHTVLLQEDGNSVRETGHLEIVWIFENQTQSNAMKTPF